MEKYTLNKKKLHHKLNKKIRLLNKDLEQDNLWRGRFVVREIQSWIREYEDQSGLYATVVLRIYDRLSGKYRDQMFSEYEILLGSKLFWFVNNFIVEDCDVWHETPAPNEANLNCNYLAMPLIAKTLCGHWDALDPSKSW